MYDEILSTVDLVNEVAASLANWWRLDTEAHTDLLWDAYTALEYLYPKEADVEINQCDGCRRGLPLDGNGIHWGTGYDMIGCTASKYKRRL